jgi:hypothetical protein
VTGHAAGDAPEDEYRKQRHPGIINPDRDAKGGAGGLEQGYFIVDSLNHVSTDQDEQSGPKQGAKNHQGFAHFQRKTD